MSHAALLACWPWMALLVACFFAAWALARFSRARLRLGRLIHLHRDQAGSAQSLSFVLTLPLFIMVMMMIVQVSQLMIGTIVVHYAAYAAARAAAVWIPAAMPDPEGPNCISSYSEDPTATDQVFPVVDPTDPNFGPTQGGVTYLIAPGSAKYDKIASAAVLACVPISPSRNLGLQVPSTVDYLDVLKSAYSTLAPASAATAAPGRLDHKLAYAAGHTDVEIRFFHKNEEPPLVTWDVADQFPDDYGEFYSNELGWQDQITVTVKHKLALLPGPGRLLARWVVGPQGGTDQVAQAIQQEGNVYVYPLQASAAIGNEGEKSVVPYAYPSN